MLEKYFSWKLFLLYFRRRENESLEVFTEIRGCCGIVSGLVISPGFRYYRIRQPHSLLHPPTFLTTATSTSTIISKSTPTKKSTSTSTSTLLWDLATALHLMHYYLLISKGGCPLFFTGVFLFSRMFYMARASILGGVVLLLMFWKRITQPWEFQKGNAETFNKNMSLPVAHSKNWKYTFQP